MGYTKQVFEDGKVLYAEELNKMSQGIVDAEKVKVIELADFHNPTQDELKALYDAAINHENFMICAEVDVSHPVYFTPINIVTMNLSDDPEQDDIVVAMTIICNYGIALSKDVPQLNIPGFTSNTTGFIITYNGTQYEAQMNAKIGSSVKLLDINFTTPTQDELKAIYDAAMNDEVFVIASDALDLGYPVQFTPTNIMKFPANDTILISAMMNIGAAAFGDLGRNSLVGTIGLHIQYKEVDGTLTYVPTLNAFLGDPAIGDMELLNTTVKDTLVDAINEVNGKAGIKIIEFDDSGMDSENTAILRECVVKGIQFGLRNTSTGILHSVAQLLVNDEGFIQIVTAPFIGMNTLDLGFFYITCSQASGVVVTPLGLPLISNIQETITVTENTDGTVDITIPTKPNFD